MTRLGCRGSLDQSNCDAAVLRSEWPPVAGRRKGHAQRRSAPSVFHSRTPKTKSAKTRLVSCITMTHAESHSRVRRTTLACMARALWRFSSAKFWAGRHARADVTLGCRLACGRVNACGSGVLKAQLRCMFESACLLHANKNAGEQKDPTGGLCGARRARKLPGPGRVCLSTSTILRDSCADGRVEDAGEHPANDGERVEDLVVSEHGRP